MRTRTGEQPHNYRICNKLLSRLGGLKTHMRTHTEDQLLSCEICHKLFFLAKSMKSTQEPTLKNDLFVVRPK